MFCLWQHNSVEIRSRVTYIYMRTQSDEKSYELTEQMIINIGDKPCECSVCGNTILLKSDQESDIYEN